MVIDSSQILASVGSPMTTFKSLIVNNHGPDVIGSTQIDAAVPSFQGSEGAAPVSSPGLDMRRTGACSRGGAQRCDTIIRWRI